MATKIFVSGFYDIIHAGHIQFFREARSLGDFLIVSFASGQVLWKSKRRKPSIPDDHKKSDSGKPVYGGQGGLRRTSGAGNGF
ncbi:adenylyltransferase/cytidyltransferase family protein [Akkermansia sp. EB-AMDK43]|uniref:adenylyltransferase/cytidyltransferase family protein n=1 Tax=Akkermansia sp. EB-AMDK43 TaxID=3073964 RepID=UPI0031B88D3F